MLLMKQIYTHWQEPLAPKISGERLLLFDGGCPEGGISA